MAIRPPPRQPAEEVNYELSGSTCKNSTVKDGVNSLHSIPETSSQVLPWSDSPVTSSHGDCEYQDHAHVRCHDHSHGHSHGADEHTSPYVDMAAFSAITASATDPHLLPHCRQESHGHSHGGCEASDNVLPHHQDDHENSSHSHSYGHCYSHS